MKLSDIVATAPAILSTGEAVNLTGPPGIGKTSICLAIAEKLGADVLLSHPAYDEPVDYKGLPVVETQNKLRVMHWTPPDNLPLAELVGDMEKPLLWILDDLGQAHPQVQNALARAFHAAERLIAGRKLGGKVYVMATSNRVEDAAAVFEMPSFARMRVTFLDVMPTPDDWCDWAIRRQDVAEEIVGYISPQNRMGGSKHLFDFDANRRTNCSPRTLHIASKHWAALQGQPEHIVDEWLSGILCPSFAIEFRAYLKLYDKLPDVPAILKGEDVDMGFAKDVNLLHVTLTAILRRAKPEHAPILAEFLNKLPVSRTDHAVAFFLQLRKLVPRIAMERRAIEWASHKDRAAILTGSAS